jgi:hypothetical protein
MADGRTSSQPAIRIARVQVRRGKASAMRRMPSSTFFIDVA